MSTTDANALAQTTGRNELLDFLAAQSQRDPLTNRRHRIRLRVPGGQRMMPGSEGLFVQALSAQVRHVWAPAEGPILPLGFASKALAGPSTVKRQSSRVAAIGKRLY